MDPSYQPPPHYMQPPPAPPSTDPSYPNYHHNHLPPPPPPPHQNAFYPAQFQYHPSHSPSPPPPPHHHPWGPPPPPPPQQPYSAHPHQSYPAPPPPPQQYPPPPHYPNQDSGNANWTHHPGYEYPGAQGNNEDWAAKARAWASRSAMENQQPQSQYASAAWQDPSHYANQYSQPIESHYPDVQQTSTPTSSYSNYQGPAVPLHRPPVVHQQEPASVSSYASESHFPYTAQDGSLGGDMSATYAQHQASTSSLIHQQEVPSSYSSIPGNEGGLHGKHGTSSLPVDGESLPVDHAQFAYGSQPLDPVDRPLDFAPRFIHENDPNISSSYSVSSGPLRGTDSVTAESSLHSWTAPVAPGASYPPMAPVFPSASQHYPASMPPIPGQPSQLYGTGPVFQAPVPSITTAGLSSGTALHAAAFPEDAYGVSMGSDRPKKAAVPNWLREEIIKTKATIVPSAPEHLKEESQSIEDDLIDKPIEKGDQADSKSMDSARSTEEEDDEGEEDAQRTAAINQEIKRVLTEVLLKVTDELFDEIAAKVLTEDEFTAEADRVPAPKISPPRPSVSAADASATVPIPVQTKKSEEHASEDSSSGAPGNILGLANYASDEDDDKQASSAPKPDASGVQGASENGYLQTEVEEQRKSVARYEVRRSNGRSIGTQADHGVPISNLNDHSINKDLDNSDVSRAYSRNAVATDKKGNDDFGDASKSTNNGYKETSNRPDAPAEKHNLRRSSRDDSQERGAKRHDKHESIKNSFGSDKYEDTESSRDQEAGKDESHGRRDGRLKKMDRTEDSKSERVKDKKERSPHQDEKARRSDSRKRSPHREGKDSKLEKERDRKRSNKDEMDKRRSSRDDGDKRRSSRDDGDKKSSKDDGDRKKRSKDDGDKHRERAEEKGDKSRQMASDAGRHKRRRSSSVGSQDKPSRGIPNLSDGSSDDASGDSRRKGRSKRRNSSPSPIRSRRRQVSRSPHSKRTQRRHSPYSSLDDSRGRRSRSRSPARRHR